VKAYNRQTPVQNPMNLVCHNRDHPSYTKEVKTWLRGKVWNPLNAVQKNHQVDSKSILSQLTKGESTWRGQLTARATRETGTLNAWKTRKTNPLWYEPFSMAAVPSPR
jgi:hypothetical protein